MTNLAADLTATARRHPERLAVRRDEVEIPYRALESAAARLAGLLVERGVRPGEHVEVRLPDVPYHVIAHLGVLRAGGVVVPLDAAAPAGTPGRAALVWHAAPGARGPACLVVAPGDFEERLAAVSPLLRPVPREGTDPAVEGAGAVRTHAELRRDAERVVRALGLGPGDGLLCAPPLTRAREAIPALHAAILAGACLTPTDDLPAAGLVANHLPGRGSPTTTEEAPSDVHCR